MPHQIPTVDSQNPYKLTSQERELIKKLKSSFLNSGRLQNHVKFLFSKGSMYLNYNSNLLYHGCIPLNEDMSFKDVKIGSSGKSYSGRAYLDRLENIVRKGYFYDKSKEENELLILRKENKQLLMENDILKQAALILARK